MSVRDAAGRHPRLTRGGRPTDDLGAQGRPARRHQARQARPTRPPAPVRRGVGPYLACLLAFSLALVESVTGAAGNGISPPAVALGSPSQVLAAVGPGRVAGGPDLVGDPDPAGDAPRRIAPSVSIAASERADAANEPPACTHDDVPALNSAYDDWATTIVDTSFALPARYQPPDLVPASEAGIAGWALVRSVVIDDLRALARAAEQAGKPLEIQSGHRSRERQAEVYAGWVASSGEADARRFSARPGHSEHQLGTALDFRAAAGSAPWSGFGSTAAGRWVATHAHEFGFVLSYPAGAEKLTCYGAEAWHVRYVGRAMAAEVEASGLPLRVWLWRHARSG